MGRSIHPNTMRRVRLAVYTRDGFACLHCRWAPPIPEDYDGRYALGVTTYDPIRNHFGCRLLELDHIHPYSLGGKFEVSNLQTLCNSCNARKGAKV